MQPETVTTECKHPVLYFDKVLSYWHYQHHRQSGVCLTTWTFLLWFVILFSTCVTGCSLEFDFIKGITNVNTCSCVMPLTTMLGLFGENLHMHWQESQVFCGLRQASSVNQRPTKHSTEPTANKASHANERNSAFHLADALLTAFRLRDHRLRTLHRCTRPKVKGSSPHSPSNIERHVCGFLGGE